MHEMERAYDALKHAIKMDKLFFSLRVFGAAAVRYQRQNVCI